MEFCGRKATGAQKGPLSLCEVGARVAGQDGGTPNYEFFFFFSATGDTLCFSVSVGMAVQRFFFSENEDGVVLHLIHHLNRLNQYGNT